MNVRITEVVEVAGGALVAFRSPAGVGQALTRVGHRPASDREYTVEFDVDPVVARGRNAELAGGQQRGFSAGPHGTTLVADVEVLDENLVAYLRVRPDCGVTVDMDGSFAVGDRIAIRLAPEDLLLTVVGG